MPTTPATVATPPETEIVKPYWLYRLAAWVGIVAGILFIVLAVSFAALRIAGHHGSHGSHHHEKQHTMGPGGMHHGHGGPGGPGGPASPGPSQPPQSVAPSLAPTNP